MIYLSPHHLPELAHLSPVERRTVLVNFSLSDPSSPRRSRRLGYCIFTGQTLGIIVGAIVFADSPEIGIPLCMLAALFVSTGVAYFLDLYSSRAALKAFTAGSSRPFVPVSDRAAILKYTVADHPRPNQAMQLTASKG